MTRTTTTTILRAWTVLAGLALATTLACAEERKVISVSGTPVTVEEASVKCEAKPPAWISTSRLADCDSATYIDIPRTGIHLIRFEIAPGTREINQGSRSELRDMYEARNGEEVWYRFSTIVPQDFPFDVAPDVVVAQWHERMPKGVQHRRPPIAHRLFQRTLRVTAWNDAAFDANPDGNGILAFEQAGVSEGVEMEYAYRVVWKQDAAGRIVAWRRMRSCSILEMKCTTSPWAKLYDRPGPLGFKDAAGYYFKMGIYTTHPFDKTLAVYHRGYRRGPSAAAVGLGKARLP